MEYILLFEDQEHLSAFEDYYKKYYRNKVDLKFSLYENYQKSQRITIGKKEKIEELNIYNKCIYLSENNLLDIYGSAKCFLENLQTYIYEERIEDTGTKLIGFSGIHGNAGSTSLSFHFSNYLGKKRKTLFLTLEKVQSGKCILEQSAESSLSNLIFYLKQNSDNVSKKIDEIARFSIENQIYYLSDVEYLEDILTLDDNAILMLLDKLEDCSFGNIVIDFGNRFDLLFKSTIKDKFFVIEQDLSQYQQIESVNKYFQRENSDTEITLLINKRKESVYLDEEYLKNFTRYHYIPYDHNMTNGKLSNEILAGISEIL